MKPKLITLPGVIPIDFLEPGAAPLPSAWTQPHGELYLPLDISDSELINWTDDGTARAFPLADPSSLRNTYRRRFLAYANSLEPTLLPELQAAGHNAARLGKWMEKWHLTDSWCVELLRRADDASSVDLRFLPLQLRLKPLFYSPVLERRSAFRKRVIDEMEVAIKKLCDAAIAQGLEMGLKPVPVHKRTRRKGIKPDPDRHCKWLARFQVLGESYPEIARGKDGAGCTRQGVSGGIEALAKQIGLTLRPVVRNERKISV